jgi:hypothetical protein
MLAVWVRLAGFGLALLMFTGCAAVHTAGHDLFTNPTGQITIDRQEFIDTFAVVKVL